MTKRRRRRRAAGALGQTLKNEPCAICGTRDSRVDSLDQMMPGFTERWKESARQAGDFDPDTWVCVYCFIDVVRLSGADGMWKDDGEPVSDEQWDEALAAVYRRTGVRQTHYLNRASWSELREQAIERHGRWCYLCDLPIADGEEVHLDHVIPRKLGGPNYWSNLRPTHRDCNLWKRARSLGELNLQAWRAEREALWLTGEVRGEDAA